MRIFVGRLLRTSLGKRQIKNKKEIRKQNKRTKTKEEQQTNKKQKRERKTGGGRHPGGPRRGGVKGGEGGEDFRGEVAEDILGAPSKGGEGRLGR